jgi:hypothetical protein
VWLAKAHEDVEQARDHRGLHLREVTETGGIERREAVPGLGLPHSCQHGGPPEEIQPCTVQAEVAIRRAYRTWEADPSRLRGLCEEVGLVGLGQSAGGRSGRLDAEDTGGSLRVSP